MAGVYGCECFLDKHTITPLLPSFEVHKREIQEITRGPEGPEALT